MNRWHYLTVTIKPDFLGRIAADTVQAELARQGLQGWELVNGVPLGPLKPLLLLFKKPA